MWHNHHQQQPPHNQMDDLSMWLRGEFAAANAIIDAICHHLRLVGEPGEYDALMGSIQQRRCNWTPILHMQQHYPVSEVIYELQQVGRRRQQQRGVGFDGGARKEFRRGGRVQRGGFEVQNFGGEVNGKGLKNEHLKSGSPMNDKSDGVGDKPKVEETTAGDEKKGGELNEKSEGDSLTKICGSMNGAVSNMDENVEVSGEDCCNVDGSKLIKEMRNLEVLPKTFVATEICGGIPVNVVDGMKLYIELIEDSGISKLIALVNDLRAAGKMGKLQGETFVLSKRPMNGHGRVMIQLGNHSVHSLSEDVATAGTRKDLKPEPIPALLQDVIEQLLNEQVISMKPDSCIIDIYSEGDYSPPHMWPQWFGRPVCLLFLTKCEMSFGKAMTMERPGDFRGALKLVLLPGSMLVMEGRSTDFARHAIPPMQKQRIIVTFVKSQPKNTNSSDVRRAPSSHWVPPSPCRPPNHIPAEHFGPVPSNGVLMTSSSGAAGPQTNPLPNGMFVPVVAVPAVTFAAPVGIPPPASAGWSPRHPPPRLPVPGTGFFLPSQSSSNQQPESTGNVGTSEDDGQTQEK